MSTIVLLPLTLILHDGRLDWVCDIPGVRFSRLPDGIRLVVDNRIQPGSRRQYSHVVADPAPNSDYHYYATLYSGRSTEKMVRWSRTRGVSVSPRFDLDSGGHETVIVATVLAMPRPGSRMMQINQSSPLPFPGEPTVYSLKSGTKTDGSGGDD